MQKALIHTVEVSRYYPLLCNDAAGRREEGNLTESKVKRAHIRARAALIQYTCVAFPIMIDLKKVKGFADWQKARGEIEVAVLEVLGDLPKERPDLQVKIADEAQRPGYTVQRINYFVEDWSRVSALLFIPEEAEENPAILCCHQTVPQGKNEPAGIDGDPNLAFARHYAERGYVTIAPDCIAAGERVYHGLEPFDTAPFYKDSPKGSAMGKMLWDHTVAVDVLCESKHVDPARIGVIGHSLGAYNAMFLTAFDERVAACVASCGFTRFGDDDTPERWARDEGFIHFPKLKEAVETGKFPFDWEHVLALAAPSPIQLLTALNDHCFSNTMSCQKAVGDAKTIYAMLGEEGALENEAHNQGHGMSPELLEIADVWFERWL
jgi:dienelactone hydrolase